MNELSETVTSKKRIFISYSHQDRKFAEQLAAALHETGEEVWWDRWEILGGDSLIQKIFEEGLAQADAFVVVLSPESVKSKWVRQELDVATVRKIEGVTKIIPVVIDNVEIPTALRALLRIDMRQDFKEGVRRITNSVHGITDKPKQSAQESIASSLNESVAGLSLGASTVGLFVLRSADLDSGDVSAFSGQDLSPALNLDPQAINDAVDELEEAGMVQTLRTLGTAPYEFYQVQPTYVLYREFSEYLDYNPEEDIQITAAAVASANKQIQNQQLAEGTGLPPGRLNRAVEYLADYGFVDRSQRIGAYPFSFSFLMATRRTRQLVLGEGVAR